MTPERKKWWDSIRDSADAAAHIDNMDGLVRRN